MKKLLIVIISILCASSIYAQQKDTASKPLPLSAEQMAKNETIRWGDLLKLTEKQSDKVFNICMVVAIKKQEILRTGGILSPDAMYYTDIDGMFKDVLDPQQYAIFRKEIEKGLPKHEGPKKKPVTKQKIK